MTLPLHYWLVLSGDHLCFSSAALPRRVLCVLWQLPQVADEFIGVSFLVSQNSMLLVLYFAFVLFGFVLWLAVDWSWPRNSVISRIA